MHDLEPLDEQRQTLERYPVATSVSSRGPFVTTRLAAITEGRDHNATPATGRISEGKDIRPRYSLWGDLAYFRVR